LAWFEFAIVFCVFYDLGTRLPSMRFSFRRIPERIYRAFVLAVATIAAIMTLM
jgi:hypothetical protein